MNKVIDGVEKRNLRNLDMDRFQERGDEVQGNSIIKEFLIYSPVMSLGVSAFKL
jgi:hypothetical protein